MLSQLNSLSQLCRKLSTLTTTSKQSPANVTRGSRRVSFASSPYDDPQLSFRQTSTPLSSTRADASPTSIVKKSHRSFFEPLHVTVWSVTEYVWQTTKTLFTYIFEQIQTVFAQIADFVQNKIAGSGKENTVYRRRSRGRPSKVVAIQEPTHLLAFLKNHASNGALWAMNKLESVASFLIFLAYSTFNYFKSAVTHVSNHYVSALVLFK